MRSLTLTALDIGTGSIKGLCASRDQKSGQTEVIAKSQCPCFGVRNGEVVRPEQVAKTIVQIKEELEKQVNGKIRDVLVNIGGSHLFSIISQGLVSVSRADQKISQEDVQRVLKAAEAVHLPSNKEVLDVFPKEFIIDGEKGIKDPRGLQGIRLEAKVVLAGIFSPVLTNLEKAVEEAGLRVLDVVISPLAASRAVLSPEQKELGVALLDIGAGDTSVAVFEKGDLVDFAVFPIGSSNITNDIAIGLRTEIQTAEKIKTDFATLKPAVKGGVDKIKITDKSLEFSKKFLRDIVESRMNDIFSEAQKALKKICGNELLPSGIVLSGGGAKLPGLVEYARQKFKLPCRLGAVGGVVNIDDVQFATCCGLLLSGFGSFGEGKEMSAGGGIGEKIKGVFKSFLP